MNTNQKKLKLVKEGIKASTLNKMTDNQIDILFGKLLEAQTLQTSVTKYSPGEVSNAKTKGESLPGGKAVKLNPDGSVDITNEQTEVDKDDENKGEVSQSPIQVQGPDRMDDDSDKELQEKFKSKSQQKLFFAKCTDETLSKKEQNKWCKMADEFAKDTNFAKLPEKKKETKESYKDMVGGALNKIAQAKLTQMVPSATIGESEIEKQILRLVEKHITPKMTKKDFIDLVEGDTKTAPAKPKTKPGTTPKHPFQPDPNKKGAPKAKKSEMDEDTKTAPAKPKTTPGTTPKHPFAPDPNKQGAPKAIKRELPSFLTFNKLGLNKK
jgi:hypothetical protein